MLIPHRQTGGLGGEIDRDHGRDIRDRKIIARHKGNIGKPGIEVGIENS